MTVDSKITLIATVLNEGDNLHGLMGSLCAQTRLPDEIVIVDGGSRDDTVRILHSYADRLPLRVLVEPGCNISEGRNSAIRAAQFEVIAVTDAGVRLSPDWLAQLAQSFDYQPGV
ncbi:MAG: glycosyltransferase, partial [Armatimonadetes bacterium]|nr:glycosyltransferase [Anaerolineae bacterium]